MFVQYRPAIVQDAGFLFDVAMYSIITQAGGQDKAMLTELTMQALNRNKASIITNSWVACISDGDDELLIGCLVMLDPATAATVYTKKSFRRLGVAGGLVTKCKPEFVTNPGLLKFYDARFCQPLFFTIGV
jgi:hypothetical protein